MDSIYIDGLTAAFAWEDSVISTAQLSTKHSSSCCTVEKMFCWWNLKLTWDDVLLVKLEAHVRWFDSGCTLQCLTYFRHLHCMMLFCFIFLLLVEPARGCVRGSVCVCHCWCWPLVHPAAHAPIIYVPGEAKLLSGTCVRSRTQHSDCANTSWM